MATLIILAFLAALCSSDITMFGQFMISRPVFSGALFGAIMGDIHMGLWIGMIVEMLWTNEIPMGSSVPVDLTMMTILPVVWTAALAGTAAGVQEAAVFSLFLAIPFVYLYREIDLKGRLFNTKIMHWVEQGIESGKEKRITYSVFLGLFLFLLRAATVYFIFFIAGNVICRQMVYLLPPEISIGLKKAWFYLPVAGFGAVLYNFRNIRIPSIHK